MCYRMLTVDPHIAGSDRNDELAGDLVTQWNSYGFDSVQTYNYTVCIVDIPLQVFSQCTEHCVQ